MDIDGIRLDKKSLKLLKKLEKYETRIPPSEKELLQAARPLIENELVDKQVGFTDGEVTGFHDLYDTFLKINQKGISFLEERKRRRIDLAIAILIPIAVAVIGALLA